MGLLYFSYSFSSVLNSYIVVNSETIFAEEHVTVFQPNSNKAFA